MIDQKTVTSSAVTEVSLPEMASSVFLQNNGTVNLRFAMGGSQPTTSTGVILRPAETLKIGGHPSYRIRGKVCFIAESGSATLDITADA